MQHAAVFKIFLDKVHHGKGPVNEKGEFKHERDGGVDDVIDRINEVGEKERETILELEAKLKGNAEELASKVSQIKKIKRSQIFHFSLIFLNFLFFKEFCLIFRFFGFSYFYFLEQIED